MRASVESPMGHAVDAWVSKKSGRPGRRRCSRDLCTLSWAAKDEEARTRQTMLVKG